MVDVTSNGYNWGQKPKSAWNWKKYVDTTSKTKRDEPLFTYWTWIASHGLSIICRGRRCRPITGKDRNVHRWAARRFTACYDWCWLTACYRWFCCRFRSRRLDKWRAGPRWHCHRTSVARWRHLLAPTPTSYYKISISSSLAWQLAAC